MLRLLKLFCKDSVASEHNITAMILNSSAFFFFLFLQGVQAGLPGWPAGEGQDPGDVLHDLACRECQSVC